MQMKRPRKVESVKPAQYPTLDDFRCGRRNFLRKLALGISIGIGAPLIVRCTGTSGITGRPGPVPELFTVRLPGEGFATAYLMDWDYLEYAVTFTTYDETFASYFESHLDLALTACSEVLSTRYCYQVQDESVRGALLGELRAALETHFAGATGSEGTWIESMSLHVESCQEMAVAGDMEYPSYP
jgi:hypothetical protein